jgi:hypothetical protein
MSKEMKIMYFYIIKKIKNKLGYNVIHTRNCNLKFSQKDTVNLGYFNNYIEASQYAKSIEYLPIACLSCTNETSIGSFKN